jgi:hypothetical protein
MGKPLENEFFINAMQEHFSDAVSLWSELPTECVLEIMPKRVSAWIYEDNKPYIERWNFENSSYIKERQG